MVGNDLILVDGSDIDFLPGHLNLIYFRVGIEIDLISVVRSK